MKQIIVQCTAKYANGLYTEAIAAKNDFIKKELFYLLNSVDMNSNKSTKEGTFYFLIR